MSNGCLFIPHGCLSIHFFSENNYSLPLPSSFFFYYTFYPHNFRLFIILFFYSTLSYSKNGTNHVFDNPYMPNDATKEQYSQLSKSFIVQVSPTFMHNDLYIISRDTNGTKHKKPPTATSNIYLQEKEYFYFYISHQFSTSYFSSYQTKHGKNRSRDLQP